MILVISSSILATLLYIISGSQVVNSKGGNYKKTLRVVSLCLFLTSQAVLVLQAYHTEQGQQTAQQNIEELLSPIWSLDIDIEFSGISADIPNDFWDQVNSPTGVLTRMIATTDGKTKWRDQEEIIAAIRPYKHRILLNRWLFYNFSKLGIKTTGVFGIGLSPLFITIRGCDIINSPECLPETKMGAWGSERIEPQDITIDTDRETFQVVKSGKGEPPILQRITETFFGHGPKPIHFAVRLDSMEMSELGPTKSRALMRSDFLPEDRELFATLDIAWGTSKTIEIEGMKTVIADVPDKFISLVVSVIPKAIRVYIEVNDDIESIKIFYFQLNRTPMLSSEGIKFIYNIVKSEVLFENK